MVDIHEFKKKCLIQFFFVFIHNYLGLIRIISVKTRLINDGLDVDNDFTEILFSWDKSLKLSNLALTVSTVHYII